MIDVAAGLHFACDHILFRVTGHGSVQQPETNEGEWWAKADKNAIAVAYILSFASSRMANTQPGLQLPPITPA